MYTGAQAFSGAYFGRRYGPVVFSNLACAGSEKTLFSSDCLVDVISDSNLCGHSKDAGVRCPGLDIKNYYFMSV